MVKNSILITFFILISFKLIGQPDKERVTILLKEAEQSNTEALIIYRDGELLIEKYFGIGHPDKLIETMSCTKSIVSLAMMALVDDGLLDSLDQPVHHIYPEWNQGRKKEITIRHLLSMTSGIQNVPNASIEIYPSPDFVKLALAAEMDNRPGAKFSYNNKAVNLLSGIVARLTNLRLDEFISARIFKPLQINQFGWSVDDAGNPHVMAGCQLRALDFAKIGLLVLNKGKYGGKQVISSVLIEEMLNPIEQYQGYGLLWWLSYEEVRYIVDDHIINRVKKIGVSDQFITRLTKLKGIHYGYDAYRRELVQVFGQDYREIILKEIQNMTDIRSKVFTGDPVGYHANGYLGNYLVIVPETQTVGVRMISHESYNWEAQNVNSFPDFIDLIQTLD